MNSNSNTIFVSALITNINNNIQKSVESYIDYGKKMLNLDIFQITFIEKKVFQEYFQEYNFNFETSHFFKYSYSSQNIILEYVILKNKIFVFFEKKDIYLYQFKNNITEFVLNTDNINKDTIEYMFVQCHKSEWVKMAIYLFKSLSFLNNSELNKYINKDIEIDNYHFLWIDFGIYHMIKDDNIFTTEIINLANRYSNIDKNNSKNKIRIASCWDLDYPLNNDNICIYKKIVWYFAGSIFGGSSNQLIDFADKMKEKCINIILEKKTIMWEINIWYLIYLENKYLFDSYTCDHNPSIIMNY